MRSYLSRSWLCAACCAAAVGCAGASASDAPADAPQLSLAQRVTQVSTYCLAACNAEAACYNESTARVDDCMQQCRGRFDAIAVDTPSARTCLDLAEAELRCFGNLSCEQMRAYYLADLGAEDYPCAEQDRAWYTACADR